MTSLLRSAYGSYAFRPAEERPVNELLLSSEEPVASHTRVCVC